MPSSLYFQVTSKKYLKSTVEKATKNHNFEGNTFTPIFHPNAVNGNDKFSRIS